MFTTISPHDGNVRSSPRPAFSSAPSRKYLGIRAPLHPLPLRCASSPYSTVCLSRAPCWRGASTLSVRQAIHETVHELRSDPLLRPLRRGRLLLKGSGT